MGFHQPGSFCSIIESNSNQIRNQNFKSDNSASFQIICKPCTCLVAFDQQINFVDLKMSLMIFEDVLWLKIFIYTSFRLPDCSLQRVVIKYNDYRRLRFTITGYTPTLRLTITMTNK